MLNGVINIRVIIYIKSENISAKNFVHGFLKKLALKTAT